MIKEVPKEKVYEAVWPRGKAVVKMASLAKRLDTLKGKTIGALWNGVFRGEEIFPMLEKWLSEQYPEVKFVPYTMFPTDGDHRFPDWKTHQAKDLLKGCDAVIIGVGC